MSEIRIPDEVILRNNQGKISPKTCKYELFQATQFAWRWTPLQRGKFHPSPPLNTERRQEFWLSRYRVRLNGRWVGDSKYTLFSREQIADMIW